MTKPNRNRIATALWFVPAAALWAWTWIDDGPQALLVMLGCVALVLVVGAVWLLVMMRVERWVGRGDDRP